MSDPTSRPSGPAALHPRAVAMGTWIGESPVDGSDVAHHVLYPAGDGVAPELMAVQARFMGLGPAAQSRLPSVDPDLARIVIAGRGAAMTSQLWLGEVLLAQVPILVETAQVATGAGWTIFSVGVDPWDGQPATLDEWLAPAARFYLGRMTVGVAT
ncbi:hypothetical protein [Pseudonocardia sp. HH130630-07]|uniref:hypothetical protein n=1 Tax=Pseudonocardia sp. HH130630-07 TaxID=1690815 RepID=UPI000814EFB6|nr:hypothetical protein [Pseudonocardia sp. HH130630-07]ANY10521.1 hypothetical protein AFB00_29340 [Pseudonocardia sp. HH130630-07]